MALKRRNKKLEDLSKKKLDTLMDEMTDLVNEHSYTGIIATLGMLIAEDEEQNMEMRSFGKVLVFIANGIDENELENWRSNESKNQRLTT